MLSGKLIRIIESHWREIAARFLRRVRQDRVLLCFGMLPESDLIARTENLLHHFGDWLAEPERVRMGQLYEEIGRLRYQEQIPLHEAVHAVHLLKDELLGFVRDQGLTQTPVDLYAEGELERRTGRFFDYLVEHMVHGYEAAMRNSTVSTGSA